MHDTEDKNWWCKQGQLFEKEFVNDICPKIGLHVCINPGKLTNPNSPDLVFDSRYADLKVQTTPFFTASRYFKKVGGKYFPFDPAYTVTFNRKDYDYYSTAYPEITIFFWVDWKETSYTSKGGTRIDVGPVSGVWSCDFMELVELIKQHEYPLHQYYRRVGDKAGNAKDSYLVDLRDLTELVIFSKQRVDYSVYDVTTVDAWL
jgi:hypothetical protein